MTQGMEEKTTTVILHQRQSHQLVLSEDDGIGWNVSRDYTIGADDAVITNGHPFQDGDVAVYFNIFTDNDWRCIELAFVPDVLGFCFESVVVVIKLAAFCHAGIITEYDFLQTVDRDIMAEIYIVPKYQMTAFPDSYCRMIAPDYIPPDVKYGIIIQFKSSSFTNPEIRVQRDAGMGVEDAVRVELFDLRNRFWNEVKCFVY